MKVNIIEDQPNGLKKGVHDFPESLVKRLIAKGIGESVKKKAKKSK
jgi:hypothetical protein